MLYILGQLASPDAFAAIVGFTGSTDARLRATAIRALAKYDGVGVYEVVARAIGSDNWEIREASVEVIRHWDWHNHEAVALASDAIHDPHPRVRDAAAKSLQHLATRAAVVERQSPPD